MEIKSVADAIEIAIRGEDLGVSFYTMLAKLFSKHTELREILELLAKDEVYHKKQFADILAGLKASEEKVDNDDIYYLNAINIAKYFPTMEDIDKSIPPTEVLHNAYNFERESVLFYTGIKDMLGDSPEIDKIISIEKSHMVKILKYILTESKFRGILDSFD